MFVLQQRLTLFSYILHFYTDIVRHCLYIDVLFCYEIIQVSFIIVTVIELDRCHLTSQPLSGDVLFFFW